MRRMRFISILVVLLISLGLVTVTLAAFGSVNNLEESRLAIGALEKSEIAFDTIIKSTMSIEDGLVAHYPFNSNANDESGNGNDGTVFGAVLTTDRFGNTDSAFSFDGDDYVEIPDDSSFDFNNNGFSLAFWIKTEAITGYYDRDDLVGKGDATIEGFTISMRENHPTFFIGDNLECGGAIQLNDGKWHHLGGTRDDANNVILYVDGKMESMCTNNEDVNTNYGMFVGKHGTLNEAYYDGVIDDIYIYNRALSADEVEMLYNYGKVKIQMEVNNPSPEPGQTIAFTIQVTNTMGEAMTGGVISDTLPSGLNFLELITLDPPLSGTVGSAPPTLVSDLEIGAGGQVTVTLPVGVSDGIASGTVLTNTAWISNEVTIPVLASASVTVANSPPIAVDDSGTGFTTDEDTNFITASVLTNDTDPNGDILVVESFDDSSTIGEVTDNGDGTFDYDPNGQFEDLDAGDNDTDTFTYTISDGNGGTDSATVTITINGVDDTKWIYLPLVVGE